MGGGKIATAIVCGRDGVARVQQVLIEPIEHVRVWTWRCAPVSEKLVVRGRLLREPTAVTKAQIRTIGLLLYVHNHRSLVL